MQNDVDTAAADMVAAGTALASADESSEQPAGSHRYRDRTRTSHTPASEKFVQQRSFFTVVFEL